MSRSTTSSSSRGRSPIRSSPWSLRPAEDEGWANESRIVAISDDSLVNAKQDLADAVENLVALLRNPEMRGAIPQTDRANLAKYLTIAKLKLENAIASVRSDNPDY